MREKSSGPRGSLKEVVFVSSLEEKLKKKSNFSISISLKGELMPQEFSSFLS